MRPIIVGQVGFFSIVALLWWSASNFGGLGAQTLPTIGEVLDTLWAMCGDRGFLNDIGITAFRILLAFLLAIPIALVTGFVLGEKNRTAKALMPFFYLNFAVPQSIFLPLFILAFGVGLLQKVIFGITHAYFAIVVNTYSAVRSVPEQYVLAARSFGAKPMQIYLRIYLPAMLPLVLTGLRLGLIFCIIGIIITEMYASQSGVGRLIFAWGKSFRMKPLMATVLLISIFTVVLNEGLRIVEIRASRKYGVQRRQND